MYSLLCSKTNTKLKLYITREGVSNQEISLFLDGEKYSNFTLILVYVMLFMI